MKSVLRVIIIAQLALLGSQAYGQFYCRSTDVGNGVTSRECFAQDPTSCPGPIIARCKANEKLVMGGCRSSYAIAQNTPIYSQNAWQCSFVDTRNSSCAIKATGYARAYCKAM